MKAPSFEDQWSARSTANGHAASVDVVTVAYNSASELRRCVEPLSRLDDVAVIVVDNASSDASLSTIDDLDVQSVPLSTNGGFAHGCNVGWRLGRAPYVLFLNPDATIDEPAIERLVEVLAADPKAGAASPLIVHGDGTNAYSLRRFPRVVSTFSQAFFLHRVFPTFLWSDELIRKTDCYGRRWQPEWVSGACVLVRRSLLERLDGWDEGFFLFGEDMDLCKRIRDLGATIVFEPQATCVHVGGHSAPKAAMLPILIESRLRYLRKHDSRVVTAVHRIGLAIGSATHAILGRDARRGHLKALMVALTSRR